MLRPRKRRRLYSGSYVAPHKRYSQIKNEPRQRAVYTPQRRQGAIAPMSAFLAPFAALASALRTRRTQRPPVQGLPLEAAAGMQAAPALPHSPTIYKQGARVSLRWRVLDVCLLLILVASGFYLGWALLFSDTSILVHYQDGGNMHTVRTTAGTVDEFMRRNGFALHAGDSLNTGGNAPLEDGMELCVTKAFPVAVASGGEVRILRMQGGSVGEALALANVEYDANDALTRLPFEDVAPGMHIQHIDVEVKYETKDQEIPFREEVIKDSSLYKGNDKVTVEGENGEKRIVRRLTYRDGVLYSREIMNQLVLKEAVDQVVVKGTRTRYQTSLTGDEREWKAAPTEKEIKKTLTAVEVTAYTHTGKRTATGRWPKIGYVAVNPNVIPYGTKLYIPGYGYCTAQDTGAFRHEDGGMKNQIDLFMNTEKECKKWGRKKNVTIYILK